MSPLPTEMIDRWLDRREVAPNEGTVYWHILMRDYLSVARAVGEVQEELSQFSELHMTPLDWLHITILDAGSTKNISRVQMTSMLAVAQRELCGLESIRVSLGKIYYHPEAVVLGVSPCNALAPLFAAAQSAMLEVVGNSEVLETSWMPHLTISYSTARQPAEPIVSTLGDSVEEIEIVVDAMTLVVQWGAERLWNWEPIGTVHLRSVTA